MLSVRLAFSKIPLVAANAYRVLVTSTKLKQEQPIAYDAWKERLLFLLDPANALRVVVAVMVITLLRQRPAVAAMFVR